MTIPGCPTAVSASATVAVAVPSPTGLQASLGGNGASVGLTWIPSAGVDSYVIQRSFNGTLFGDYDTAVTSQFTDIDVQIATRGIVTYVYRIVAVAGGTRSLASNSDIATRILFTDDPLVNGVTPIRSVHIDEARQAVDAVRASAGLPRIWTATASVAGSLMFAWQFGEAIPASPPRDLLTALNQGRAALGMPSVSYGTLPFPAPGVAIAGQYLTSIRNGVK